MDVFGLFGDSGSWFSHFWLFGCAHISHGLEGRISDFAPEWSSSGLSHHVRTSHCVGMSATAKSQSAPGLDSKIDWGCHSQRWIFVTRLGCLSASNCGPCQVASAISSLSKSLPFLHLFLFFNFCCRVVSGPHPTSRSIQKGVAHVRTRNARPLRIPSSY